MSDNTNGGAIIISYDDGVTEDYTVAYQVHLKHGVPAELCMPSSYVDQEGRVTKSHLLEMQSSGWEIVSHTKHHISLGDESLTRNAGRGDVKLYVSNPKRFKPGIRLSVAGNGKTEDITVTGQGKDSYGGYLLLEREIGNSYTGTLHSGISGKLRRVLKSKSRGAIVAVSDNQALTEIETSRRELESMGLNVRHFTYPYNRYSPRTRELVSRHYDSARAGSAGERSDRLFDRYALRSINFERNRLSDEELWEILERIKEQSIPCFLHAHTRSAEFSAERLEKIITVCMTLGICISTRSRYFSST
jgi:peptidoglycan/xylan/chitin deacetylase (PgdA/CDA1 family)